MTERQIADFAALCLEDRTLHGSDGDSIGTYNEKRFHRVYKRLVTEDASCYEVRIGRYVADVLCDGHITEIQTGSFRPLTEKLRYYLNETDCTVNVVKPIVAEKRIIRTERDTGEILSDKRSPKRGRPTDILPDIYHISEFIGDPRFSLTIELISAEELRFSDRVRYRRSGAYDSDLIPVSSITTITVTTPLDLKLLLPPPLLTAPFTSSDFSRQTTLRSRRLSFSLNTLISLNLLERERIGKAYVYKVRGE